MKRITSFLIFVAVPMQVLAIILANVTSTAFAACQNGISIMEQASVKVVPDEVTLVLSIEELDPDVNVAIQKNRDDLSKLKDFLKKERVGGFSVDPTSIETRYSQTYVNGAQSQTVNGYAARTTLTAMLTDLSNFKAVSAGAITHGATNIIGAQLRSSQYDKARAESCRQALSKARARALELAQQLGQQTGLVTDVIEVGNTQPWSIFNALSSIQTRGMMPLTLANLSGYGAMAPADAAIESDKIIVSSNISLCMEFKDIAAREKR